MSDRTLLVSRHPGAKAWLAAEVARRGWAPAHFVDHLDPDADLAGIRRVAGTLPLGLAGRLAARGIEIWHLDLTLAADCRGRELSMDDMQRWQARLLRVIALQLEDQTMARTMILLVSAQPMANLLAALAPGLDVGEVHLLVSGDMRSGGQGDHLADVLAARGLGVHWHDVTEPFQPEATRGIVAQLLAGDPDRFLVNLTGGTKPMSLGAYRAAVDAGVRDILYTDHESGLMRWLEGNRPPFPVSTKLRVGEVVQAHGYTSRPAADPQASLLDVAFRIDRVLGGPGLLHAWNRLMFEVERRCRHGHQWNPETVPLSAARSSSHAAPRFDEGALARLLSDAAGHGLLTLTNDQISIADPNAHAFLAGGWWELLVWKALRDQAHHLDLHDLVRNLDVKDMAGASNEIDVAAMRGRNLLLFECKTVRLTGSDTREKAGNILYKLEHLARLGGLGTRLFLVSRERLEGRIPKRFEAERVGLVHGVGAPDLPAVLARIIAAA